MTSSASDPAPPRQRMSSVSGAFRAVKPEKYGEVISALEDQVDRQGRRLDKHSERIKGEIEEREREDESLKREQSRQATEIFALEKTVLDLQLRLAKSEGEKGIWRVLSVVIPLMISLAALLWNVYKK